jgi:hypothetical protein
MKNNKSNIAATLLLAFLLSIGTFTSFPLATGQLAIQQPTIQMPSGVTPDMTVTTEAYLSFRPNPVGVGQPIIINVWLHPPTNVNRDFILAFQITITKPDGTKETKLLSSYAGDSTGWFEYTPDTLGTYKIKFNFLGQYYPAGQYYAGNIVTNSSGQNLGSVYYKPSEAPELNLTVQQEQILSWPMASLPTDYWTRPVHPQNREWWPILGAWPPTGIVGGGPYWPEKTNTYMNNYKYVPYVQGPTSAHIVWERAGSMGGLIGGAAGQITDVLFAGTGVIGFPNIIYAGRAYMTVPKVSQNGTSTQTYWQCYDIRTGQIFWERPLYAGETAPSIVEYEEGNTEVPGAEARVGTTIYLTALISPTSTTAGRIIKYSPWTSAITSNVTGPPAGVGAGTLYAYPYVYSVQTIGSGSTAQYRLLKWTIESDAGQQVYSPYGTPPVVDNFTQRLISNITWPFNSLGTCDFETGISVNNAGINSAATGTSIGQRLVGVSLSTGNVLWNTTTDLTSGLETFFSGGISMADHGLYAGRMQNGQWWAWDLKTGQIVWKSDISAWPWGAFGAYSMESAYGLIYSRDYDGVHAINWTNGNIEWTFNAKTPYQYETPYEGNYAFHGAGQIADGKLYTFSVEHSPSQPITRGDRFYCLNATTGELIWSITLGQNAPGSRVFQGSLADGYLAHTDEYTGNMLVFGKGKSATTIETPLVAIQSGQSMIIKGTVLDQSPAQSGTPCVSDESMATQMEYLHMQSPIDGVGHNATIKGVTISLDTTDPNGNQIHIADVTTDGYSGTYGYTWKPEIIGQYAITATFKGDDSYGSSFATTYATVEETAPTATTTTSISFDEVNTNVTGTVLAAAVAIIIAIAILGVLVLRKKS